MGFMILECSLAYGFHDPGRGIAAKSYLLTRNMPFPCALPMGFMIQDEELRRNSSTKRL